MLKRYLIYFASFFFILNVCLAQTGELEKMDPSRAFEYGNYPAAITGFLDELKTSPEDYHTNLILGICYLESHIDYSKSIPYLEKIKDHKENDFEVLYYLGRAYHLNYKLDDAINTFKLFTDSCSDSSFVKQALRQIEMCKNAKRLMASPVNVTIENMGDTVNSKAPDYNVFVEQDESFIVFSSKRKKRNKAEGPSPEGFYTSDVFISYYEEGAWQKAKVQSNICTPVNEESVGLTADGNLLFLKVEGRGVSGDMVVSNKKGKSFKEPVKVEKTVNSSAEEMTSS
ncbi:MAG: tetratricopeptide repeat protein, partial [Flavobacteriales bacterium]|nr:tetratricopeptide repeat protein [Flavobacteriales bacterium]